jgi:putative ABC transport system permease protein
VDHLDTWRAVQNANRPDAFVADDVVQVLVVRGDGSSADLAAAIDAATGSTSTLTVDEAVNALPGVKEQGSTFDADHLRHPGRRAGRGRACSSRCSPSSAPASTACSRPSAPAPAGCSPGVVLQAIVVALIAFVIGGCSPCSRSRRCPPTSHLQLTVGRYVFTFVALIVAAVLGSAISLRRVTRIDPPQPSGVPHEQPEAAMPA